MAEGVAQILVGSGGSLTAKNSLSACITVSYCNHDHRERPPHLYIAAILQQVFSNRCGRAVQKINFARNAKQPNGVSGSRESRLTPKHAVQLYNERMEKGSNQ
jgi:hypothetical protein